MSDILPIWSTHYSLGDSILTLDEPGKTEAGNPVSICDLAREHHIKQIVICDTRIDGFLEGFKNLSKPFKPTPPKPLDDYIRDEQGENKKATDLNIERATKTRDEAQAKYDKEMTWYKDPIQLIYGLKLVVVSDMMDKTPESTRGESSVIVFIRNTQGYNDVLRLWSRAWVEGHYIPPANLGDPHGRIDWQTLKTYWTPNLTLALPYFSSFLAKNTLTFANLIPDLSVPSNEVTLLKEIDAGLPFVDLIDGAIERFASDTGASIQPVKTIYYEKRVDFPVYMTYRAHYEKGDYSAPNVDDLASDHFSFEDYLKLKERP